MATIEIRPANPTEANYVLKTTRDFLLHNSAYCAGTHASVMTKLLESLLAFLSVDVAVAGGAILGFIVYERPNTVAFLYVRNAMRKKGIARALLANAQILVPSTKLDDKGVTRAATEIVAPFLVTKFDGCAFPRLAEEKGYKIRFRPYLALDLQARALGPAELRG